jgi:tetratricopeptide (TPR) repeat protein
MESENLFAGTISELSSPFAASAHRLWPLAAFKLLLALTLVAALWRIRRPRPFDLGLVIVFSILAGLAVRSISLFVVATLPVTLESGQLLLNRLRGRSLLSARGEILVRRGATAATFLLALVLLTRAVTGAHYLSDRRPTTFGRGLSPAVYPLATVDYLVDRRIGGPIYNHLNFGGYLIGRLWPDERVFIDGRLEVMGEEFYEEYLNINAGPGWPAMMERYEPRVALVPHTFLKLVTRLDRDSRWALVKLDGVGALFLRVSTENGPFLAEARRGWEERRRKAEEDKGPLEPRRNISWLTRLLGRRSFPWEAYGRGNALYGLGLYAEARAEYREALRLSDRDYAPLTGNLAAACYRLGLREESLAWYRRTLELDPDYPRARERVESLRLLGGTAGDGT